LESNQSNPENLKFLVEKINNLQNKMSEQERIVTNLTKLVELNSSIESTSVTHKFKQEFTKIESTVDRKLHDLSKQFVDRQIFESRLNQIETNNRVSSPQKSNRLYSNE